jgi:predicted S18 family serine protease
MTDVGIIKADASTIKTSVEGVPTLTIAIWIAVVLSLIAAIAAIYSVVTIHRKIAG